MAAFYDHFRLLVQMLLKIGKRSDTLRFFVLNYTYLGGLVYMPVGPSCNRLIRILICNCYVLTFWPGQKCHSRWCTGRKWYILMAVMRGNRVGGNWLMKWDELKISHDTLIDWRTGREWPLNCMTVISAWWRLNIRFQRSSGRSCRRWTII